MSVLLDDLPWWAWTLAFFVFCFAVFMTVAISASDALSTDD
jgi:hypothetical protein